MKKHARPGISRLLRMAIYLLLLVATAMEAEEMFLASHDYCPYSCPGETRQGIYLDLSKKPILFFRGCFVTRHNFDWHYRHQKPYTPLRLGLMGGVDYSGLSEFFNLPEQLTLTRFTVGRSPVPIWRCRFPTFPISFCLMDLMGLLVISH